MSSLFKALARALPFALSFSLAACGGGTAADPSASSSGPSSTPARPARVEGVAAVGAAIAGQEIDLKDSAGAVLKTTSDASGNFGFDVSALTAPFMLRVQQPDGTLLYSASTNGGIANINPLSNLILGKLGTAASIGADPSALYQGFATFKSQLGASALDKATAQVYQALSAGFKAQMSSSGADFNPIFAPYQIGSALDQSFDQTYLFYEPQGGDFQEKPAAQIQYRAFGPLAKFTTLRDIAGRYTAQAVLPSGATQPVLISIDNQGRVIVDVAEKSVLLGHLLTGLHLAPGAPTFARACWYTLDAVGNSRGGADGCGSIALDPDGWNGSYPCHDKLCLEPPAVTAGSAPAWTSIVAITPDIDGTYGNNLKAGAKAFKSATLGPYQVGDGSSPRFGSSGSSTTVYTFGKTTTEVPDCRDSMAWSVALADVELSLYSLTLTETLTDAKTTACPLGDGTYDLVGRGMFVDAGLVAVYTDKDSADAPETSLDAHAFVSVKLWKPK